MTVPTLPRPARARLRPDAPTIRGLSPGDWYDVLPESDERGRTIGFRVRPRDALAGDESSYIAVSANMVELADADGRRLFSSADGRRWLASFEPAIGGDGGPATESAIRFTGSDGEELLAPGVAVHSIAQLGDRDLEELLDACLRPPGADAPEAETPARASGLRVEARLKPGFAWAYRMLSPDSWYEVDQAKSSEYGIVIHAPDGERIIGADHVETRSMLE